MTLIELLVSIMVIGAIVAVLAATVTVTLRQNGDTQGRLDVARWGQSLAVWLPTDLASAADVSADVRDPITGVPVAPCPSAQCTFGSNALWLTWDDGSGPTTVSYRYGRAADGVSFVLTRVECKGSGCSSRIVLRDLSGPVDDDGNALPWNPGDPVPDSVIDVTVPVDVNATTPTGPLVTGPTHARRVTVNVNGMPGIDGIDRSSSVNFTAGGTSFETLDPTTYEPPKFLQASSGCGGPVTLIVDRSGSIGSDMDEVQDGVRSFVKAFEGTPTRLQIVTFSAKATTLGTGGWNRFFDLADPDDVITLIGTSGNSGLVSGINANGATNWEDALYRTFYASTGQSYELVGDPNRPTPEIVVFFTDGVPTFDRLEERSDSNSTTQPVIGSNTTYSYKTARADNSNYGSSYSPRGWRRADYILDQFRLQVPEIRMIGVGVGEAFEATAIPSTDNSTKVYHSGWPGPTSTPDWIPNRVFLGDLMVDDNPNFHGDGSNRSGGAITRDYIPGAPNNGWGDVSDVNLLVTDDFDHLGGALTAIALVDCGGTLTVQTRDQANASADADVTYGVGTDFVTTTRLAKSGTFDIDLDGIASTEVVLVPQSLVGTGYTAQSWGCRAAGANLVAGASLVAGNGYHLVDPLNLLAGIAVTVSANAAVSCTLRVTP